MSTVISAEQVQQLLARSRKLNEMKAEIDTVVGMALGLLAEAELSRFRRDAVVCEFATHGLGWKVVKMKRGLVVSAYSINDSYIWPTVYDSFLGIDCTAMRYVSLVHRALPDLLTNLIKVFPQLENQLTPFLEVASQ